MRLFKKLTYINIFSTAPLIEPIVQNFVYGTLMAEFTHIAALLIPAILKQRAFI